MATSSGMIDGLHDLPFAFKQDVNPPFHKLCRRDHPVESRAIFTPYGQKRIAWAADVLHFRSSCWHGATVLDGKAVPA
jgi:hypothetical protein